MKLKSVLKNFYYMRENCIREKSEIVWKIWLNFFLNWFYSAFVCSCNKCRNQASLGAHLWLKERESNENCFIAPMCTSCNLDRTYNYNGKKTAWISLKKNTFVIKNKVLPEMFDNYYLYQRRKIKSPRNFVSALFSKVWFVSYLFV